MKPEIKIDIDLNDEVYDQIDKLKMLYNGGDLTKEQLLDNVRLFVIDNLNIDVVSGDQFEEENEVKRKKKWFDFWKK